jgi:nucleoredoxin
MVVALAVSGRAEDTNIAEQMKSHLVKLEGGTLKHLASPSFARTKYVAIYYSAQWCPPCRAFSPELVKFYNEIKPAHPEFELIFVSRDNSEGDMLSYMKSDSMPWPALKFGFGRTKQASRYAGTGIPCLVLTDATGKVLSHSYVNGNYVGPRKVLEDIRKTLTGS